MIYTVYHEAVWTHWTISREWSNEDTIWTIIVDLLNDFQQKYSRFDSQSILSQLNQKRILHSDDAVLVDMIRHWEQAQILTNGLFSLFVWSHLENLWYNANYDFVPTKKLSDISQSKIIIDNHIIQLVWDWNLDLGWLWKWYVIDVIKNQFIKEWITSFLINWWWDIYQQDLTQLRWTIMLQDPINLESYVWATSSHIWWYASSGTKHRKRWDDLHHLIDATTGMPVITSIIWVYTYHFSSALLADIASTILFISPLDKIEYYSKELWVEFFILFSDYSSIRSSWYPFKLI